MMLIFQVDAFSDRAFGGNPAGVVLLDRDLNDETMLNIAKEMNLSETVFVKKLDDDSNGSLFECRYFTITDEVDMCGHATISALSIIMKEFDLPFIFNIKTKAGIINVSIENGENGFTYYFKQPEGNMKNIDVSRETLERVLNINAKEIGSEFNIEPTVYSTGLFDLLVPIVARERLNAIMINKNEMIKDSENKEIVGYHCYTVENEIIYARNFAPLFGIDEETATGTSNGALLTLLYESGAICKGAYKIIQGEAMGKPTKIYGRIDEDGVWIGGQCYELFRGTLNI